MLTLVDTGPLVAVLDSGDAQHDFVRQRWAAMSGRFVTTEAVITEALHFLRRIPEGPRSLLQFIDKGVLGIDEAFRVNRLHRAVGLMERYADTPMDFADATLVVLADELETARVLTLDERGFRSYRFSRNRAFALVLQDT